MAPPKITSFLIKLASRCNLDCDYCYVYHHADQSWRSMPRFLSASDRIDFVRRLANYVRDEKIDRCAVILHGGEPLLAGAEAIVEFAKSLRSAVGPSAAVDIGLQTNGVSLTDEAAGALERADVAVSLSLDGPEEVNDRHRKTRKGRSSFKRTLAALERLKKRPTIFSGIIAVVDAQVDPETLFGFFDRHKPPKIDFLLPDSHHLRPPPGRGLHPALYADWLVRAFDLWFDRYPHLRVRTFEALLDAIAGLPSGTDAFGLGDVSLLTIETDGSYHDLDVLKVVAEGATKLGGSVRDTDIASIASSPAVAAHRRLLTKAGLSPTCQACPEVGVCGGGSVPHRFGPNGFTNPSVYCTEMLSLIRHIRTRLSEALAQQTTLALTSGGAKADEFDFQSFERAENACEIIEDLWRNSSAEQTVKFCSALDLILNSDPNMSSSVGQLRALDQEAVEVQASRPGCVAWQRTIVSSSVGKKVFTVDGTQLHADASYLGYIERTHRLYQAGLQVAAADPWLRAPFGSAILFEPEEIAQTARPVVQQALDIIAQWRPALEAELRRICKDVQFVRDPTADPEKIVSFSDNVVPGALFVSVTRGNRLIDPYDLADSLIHEHRHQKLYLLERLFPMIEPTDLKVISPWRADLRPPSGLMHAVFVFVELRRFWQHVRESGPTYLAQRAINQLRETDANLEEGLRTLRSCPLTSAGKALTQVLDQARTAPRAAA